MATLVLLDSFQKHSSLLLKSKKYKKKFVATLVLLDSFQKHSSLLFKSKKYKKSLWLR